MNDESTYSIIIPYRDRKEHLELIVPVLRRILPFAEIIVVEQNDTNKFKKSCLLNVGSRFAKGDVLIFQDVDYVLDEASSAASYGFWEKDTEEYNSLAVLPVHRARFVDMNLTDLPNKEIPSGYRHFKNRVDDDFFGGCVMLSRPIFKRIRGFNPNFEGWGLEDADIRKRLQAQGLGYYRSSGEFLVLPHKDSNPGAQDESFAKNVSLYHDDRNTCSGDPNLVCDILTKPNPLVDQWILTTNFKVIDAPSL